MLPTPPPTTEQYLSNCLAAAVQDTAATRCEDLGLEPRPVEVYSTLIKGTGPERRVILYGLRQGDTWRATAAAPPALPPHRYEGAELRAVQAERQRQALTTCARGLAFIAGKTSVYPELLTQLPECQQYGARPTLRTEGLGWTQAQLELTAPLADGSTFRWPAEQRPGVPPPFRRALAWGAGMLAGGLIGAALSRVAASLRKEPPGWLGGLGRGLAWLTLGLGLLTAPLTLPNLHMLGEASLTLFPALLFGTLPALSVLTLALAGVSLAAAGLWALLLTPFLAGGLLALLWSGLPFAEALTLGTLLGLPVGGWLSRQASSIVHNQET